MDSVAHRPDAKILRKASIGRRYETVGAPWLVWEVVKIVAHPISPHARLRRIDHHETIKTVSIAALRHDASYRPVAVD